MTAAQILRDVRAVLEEWEGEGGWPDWVQQRAELQVMHARVLVRLAAGGAS